MIDWIKTAQGLAIVAAVYGVQSKASLDYYLL